MTPAGAKFGRHAGFGSPLGIADIAAQAREETHPLGFELGLGQVLASGQQAKVRPALL